MFKLPHDALMSHTSKVMLKILQGRLQQYINQWEESRGEGEKKPNKKQYMNWEFPDVKLDLEKVEEPEIKSPTSTGS